MQSGPGHKHIFVVLKHFKVFMNASFGGRADSKGASCIVGKKFAIQQVLLISDLKGSIDTDGQATLVPSKRK